jgi:hypothetical protein
MRVFDDCGGGYGGTYHFFEMTYKEVEQELIQFQLLPGTHWKIEISLKDDNYEDDK